MAAHEYGCAAVIDDRDARRKAQELGVKTTGTLGLLRLLVRRQVIVPSEAERTYQTMRSRGRWLPPIPPGFFGFGQSAPPL